MIEVLVAITIAATMLISISSILMSINTIHQRTTDYYEISKIAQSVIEELNIVEGVVEKEFDTEEYVIEITKEKITPAKEIYSVRLALKHTSQNMDYLLYSYIAAQDVIPQNAYHETPIETTELLD